MAYLSHIDLENIGLRVIQAYKKLPEVYGQPLDRIDIDYLIHALLGLRIDYSHLSPDGNTLGLTSFCEIGIEVFPKEPDQTDELYYMLDGKTILIERDLIAEGANIGRRNYTAPHEGCHHILKMLFPHDYGTPISCRTVHYYCRERKGAFDWEEWQVETLAGIILMPKECIDRCMEYFGLGAKIRLLNRVFAAADYKHFAEMAQYMGVSKTALSIRLAQLGRIGKNNFMDPYALVRVEMDEEDADV